MESVRKMKVVIWRYEREAIVSFLEVSLVDYLFGECFLLGVCGCCLFKDGESSNLYVFHAYVASLSFCFMVFFFFFIVSLIFLAIF
ncbi:hypothetical protein HanIR_Chr13g0623951 [Helianthus annuus]|nr:hypothetical protein HanIR_Chr13g0623951 [Helianthus annuus]